MMSFVTGLADSEWSVMRHDLAFSLWTISVLSLKLLSS